MGKLDTILDILADGKWHSVEEILAKGDLDLNEDEVKQILSFFDKFELLSFNEQEGKAMVYECTANWWKGLREKY